MQKPHHRINNIQTSKFTPVQEAYIKVNIPQPSDRYIKVNIRGQGSGRRRLQPISPFVAPVIFI